MSDTPNQNGGAPNPEFMKRLVMVIQKLEEEINTNKRTLSSKVKGTGQSITNRIQEVVETIESMDDKLTDYTNRGPEELATEPIKKMISDAYTSIQVKCSADLLDRTVKSEAADQSLTNRLEDEKRQGDRVVLSLATDIVSVREKNEASSKELNSRLYDLENSPMSSATIDNLQATVMSLSEEVRRLRSENDELKSSLNRELFASQNERVKMKQSIDNRFMFGG